jgi:uncharacterized membrane protein
MAVRPFSDFLHTLVNGDAHPPLYYLLLRPLGPEILSLPGGLRSLSFVFGALQIPAAAFLGRALFGPAAGLWAAFFTAFSALHVATTQEARFYPLLGLLSLLGWLALLRSRDDRRYLFAFSTISVAALYTNYFAAHIILAQAIWAFLPASGLPRKSLIGALGAVAALFLPWMPSFLTQLSRGAGPSIPIDLTRGLWSLLIVFPFGFTHPGLSMTAALAPSAFVAISTVRAKPLAGLVPVLLGPAVHLAMLLSIQYVLGRNIVQARYFYFLLPYYAIALACGLPNLKGWAGKISAALLVLLWLGINGASLYNWYARPEYKRENWRDSAAFLARRIGEADAVVLQNSFKIYSFKYYFDRGNTVYLLSGKDAREPAIRALLDKLPRIWYVSCQAYATDPNFDVAKLLGATRRVKETAVFENAVQEDERIVVICFEPRYTKLHKYCP